MPAPDGRGVKRLWRLEDPDGRPTPSVSEATRCEETGDLVGGHVEVA